MLRTSSALTTCLVAGLFSNAYAADAPLFAPAPAWVLPAPATAATQSTDPSGARVLLQDTQINFTATGFDSYVHTIVRLDSPQALASAGTIAMPWRPSSDTVTFHAINIRRGQQVINALDKQKVVVLRRENNLEAAMLDGVLTATLQIEGLQVGDIVEFESSMSRADAVMKGAVDTGGIWVPGPHMDQMRLRARWSSEKNVRWRFGAAFTDTPKITSAGGTSELLFEAVAPKAWRPPSGAPLRYMLGGFYEFSDSQSWADVSRKFSPLYDTARSVGERSPLKAEAAKIRAASADPKVQALAALALVQNNVRYVALTMAEGNLTPASADETWERRFGDCKGKTALLLALLDQLGIAAEPALVSVQMGDGLNERLPRAGAFDHVIVRATIGGVTYWLDGAQQGDTDLAALRNSSHSWALPLRSVGADLVALPDPPLDKPIDDARLTLDVSAGPDKPAPARAEMILRGDVAKAWKLVLANAAATDQDAALKSFWNDKYAFLKPTKVSARFDAATNEQYITAEGVATLDWRTQGASKKYYEVEGSFLGWAPNLARLDGEDQKAPYAVPHPLYSIETVTVRLPKNGAGYTFNGANYSNTIGGITFTRTSGIQGGALTMRSVMRSIASEFPAAEAEAVTKSMRDLTRNGVYLYAPADEAAVQADVFADLRAASDSGAGDAVLNELNKAVAASPGQAPPLMMRSSYYVSKGDTAKAKADLQAALSIDPAVNGGPWIEGQIAMREGRFPEAIAALTRQIAVMPHPRSYEGRARAYAANQEKDKALADTAEALRLDPALFSARQLRLNILRSDGQIERALAELNEATLARPNDDELYVLKGAVLVSMNRRPEALAAYDQAIALKPSPFVYMNRANAREDDASKLADIASALALDPNDVDARLMRAGIYTSQSKFDAALTDVNAVIGDDASSPYISSRARIYAKKGQNDLAAKDFSALRASAQNNPTRLNNLCWDQAALGLFLDVALTDCDAALRIAPDESAYLDSRAFVLLRLGRLDEAISVYDASLAKNPRQSASLFGRGIAKMRKGLRDDGAKDLAAARQVFTGVDKQFAEYGVTPP